MNWKPVFIGGPANVADSEDVLNTLLPQLSRNEPTEILFVREIPDFDVLETVRHLNPFSKPDLDLQKVHVYTLKGTAGGTAFYEFSHTTVK